MAGESPALDVCVVGAGIAGLSAARKLTNAGLEVLVLDKSRGVSGRAATRRWAGHRVDHGAQFFSVRSREFEEEVDRLLSRKVCFRWSKGFHRFDGQSLQPPDSACAHPRYACAEGMSALGKAIAEQVAVRCETKVERASRHAGCWQLTPLNGETVRARTLILGCPAPQARALLDDDLARDERGFTESLESIGYAPSLCVVGLYGVDEPEWKGVQLADDPVLAWIGNDSSKRAPGDSPSPLVLVYHASADFSAKYIQSSLEEAADKILARAGAVLGAWAAAPVERFVHRWRYAFVSTGFTQTGFLKSGAEPTLYAVGDAFKGARIEGAYLSGLEAANDILVGRK